MERELASRGQNIKGQGVAPVSILLGIKLLHFGAAESVSGPLKRELLADGDRREACPTAQIM